MKRGSKIAQSGKEDHLFDNAFEIELLEDYEDNYLYRDIERAVKEEEERREFRKMLEIKSKKAKSFKSPRSSILVQKLARSLNMSVSGGTRSRAALSQSSNRLSLGSMISREDDIERRLAQSQSSMGLHAELDKDNHGHIDSNMRTF